MGGQVLDYETKRAYKSGIEQGIEQGKLNAIKQLLTKLSPDEIQKLGFSDEDILQAQS